MAEDLPGVGGFRRQYGTPELPPDPKPGAPAFANPAPAAPAPAPLEAPAGKAAPGQDAGDPGGWQGAGAAQGGGQAGAGQAEQGRGGPDGAAAQGADPRHAQAGQDDRTGNANGAPGWRGDGRAGPGNSANAPGHNKGARPDPDARTAETANAVLDGKPVATGAVQEMANTVLEGTPATPAVTAALAKVVTDGGTVPPAAIHAVAAIAQGGGTNAPVAMQALATAGQAGGAAATLAQQVAGGLGTTATGGNGTGAGQPGPGNGAAAPNGTASPLGAGQAGGAVTPATLQTLANTVQAGGAGAVGAAQTLSAYAQGGGTVPQGPLQTLALAAGGRGAAAPAALQALSAVVQAGGTVPPAALQTLASTVQAGGPAAPGAAQALSGFVQAGGTLPQGAAQTLALAANGRGAAAPAALQTLATVAQAGGSLPPAAVQALANTVQAGGPAAPGAAQALAGPVQAGGTPPGAGQTLALAAKGPGAAVPAAIQAPSMVQAGGAVPPGGLQMLATAVQGGGAAAPAAAQAFAGYVQAGGAMPPATVQMLVNAVRAGGAAAPRAAQALAGHVQAGGALPQGALQALALAANGQGAAVPVLAAVVQAGGTVPAAAVQSLAGAVQAGGAAASSAAGALATLARAGGSVPPAALQAVAAFVQSAASAPASSRALNAAAAIPPSVQSIAASVLAGSAVPPAAMQALLKAALDQVARAPAPPPSTPNPQQVLPERSRAASTQADARPLAALAGTAATVARSTPALAQPQALPTTANADAAPPAQPVAPPAQGRPAGAAALTMAAPAQSAATRYAALDASRPDLAPVAGLRPAAPDAAPMAGALTAGAFSPFFAARILGAAAPLAAGTPTPPQPGNPILQTLLAAASTAEAAKLDKAVLDATMRLPGPLGRLLTDGVAPGLALAAQQLWEGSVLGGWNPATGSELQPLWVRWRLGSAGELDALVERLTGLPSDLVSLARTAELPSRVGALLLGLPASALPAVPMDPRRMEPSLLSLGAMDFMAGLNGLVRLDSAPTHLSGATGLSAVGTPDGSPLLLAHLRPVPTAADRIALGAGLSFMAGAAGPGIPASATVAWSGTLPDPALGSMGTVGGLGADRAGDRAGAVLAQLAAMLLAGVRQGSEAPSAVAVEVPFDGSPAGGAMRFASGKEVSLGSGLPGLLSGAAVIGTGPAPEARVSASLGLGGPPVGRGGAFEVLGPHVTYNERRAVPLDVAPASPGVASWRLDDTATQAAVGLDGIGPALAGAKRLYRSLQAGKLRLDAIPRGHGMSTWDGSPAWLGLAQVSKPAASGVLPGEAEPPRLDLVRAPEGDWLLLRRGGKEGRASRQAYASDAGDDVSFYQDVVFGVPHGAELRTPGGAAGALALKGFRHARAAMAEPRGRDRLAQARSAEAWGLVARLWAGVLERLARTGAGRLSTRGDAASQAGALREIASWSGSVPALVSARDARLDLGAVLAAVGADTRASLTRALAPAAVLVSLLERPENAVEGPPEWPHTTRLVATGSLQDLQAWGAEVLQQVLDGQPHRLDWDGAAALAAALGRV